MNARVTHTFFIILLLLMAGPGPAAMAARYPASGPGARPGPPPSNLKTLPLFARAYGRTYAEWAAAWAVWALPVPNEVSPILDNTGEDAALNQSGKVWFLAGTAGGAATRSVKVPPGRALFFPLVNTFWINTPETGDNPWSKEQEALARQAIALRPEVLIGLSLEVDGKSLAHPETTRVQSEVFTVVFPVFDPPDDNIFFNAAIQPGPHPGVADGYWVLLPPLSAGRHLIHFSGGFTTPTGVFSLDTTYRIEVGH